MAPKTPFEPAATKTPEELIAECFHDLNSNSQDPTDLDQKLRPDKSKFIQLRPTQDLKLRQRLARLCNVTPESIKIKTVEAHQKRITPEEMCPQAKNPEGYHFLTTQVPSINNYHEYEHVTFTATYNQYHQGTFECLAIRSTKCDRAVINLQAIPAPVQIGNKPSNDLGGWEPRRSLWY